MNQGSEIVTELTAGAIVGYAAEQFLHFNLSESWSHNNEMTLEAEKDWSVIIGIVQPALVLLFVGLNHAHPEQIAETFSALAPLVPLVLGFEGGFYGSLSKRLKAK